MRRLKISARFVTPYCSSSVLLYCETYVHIIRRLDSATLVRYAPSRKQQSAQTISYYSPQPGSARPQYSHTQHLVPPAPASASIRDHPLAIIERCVRAQLVDDMLKLLIRAHASDDLHTLPRRKLHNTLSHRASGAINPDRRVLHRLHEPVKGIPRRHTS